MNANTNYMYRNQYFKEYLDLDKRKYCIDRDLTVKFVDNAIILPARKDQDRFWGVEEH